MKNKITKKFFATIGIVASALLVLCGILAITGFFDHCETHQVRGPSAYVYDYDYGYATFGADFYNYVANNAGQAGEGVQGAANNLDEIFEWLKLVFGAMMICFGFGGVAAFGILFLDCTKTTEKNTDTAENSVAVSEECDTKKDTVDSGISLCDETTTADKNTIEDQLLTE